MYRIGLNGDDMSNLIAHRALEKEEYKENTKEAVIYSLTKDYIKGIEIDIRLTKDKKLVIVHDNTINRTSNGNGFVKNMTLKQLKKYNFGTKDNPSRIVTLKEVLELLPNDKILLIELKCTENELEYINIFYYIIKNYLDKNIYVMSFNEKIIERLKRLHPEIRCGLLMSKIINKKYLSKDFDFIAISSYSVDEVKSYKKTLFVWALASKKRYKELERQLKKDTYYIVDYPKKYI